MFLYLSSFCSYCGFDLVKGLIILDEVILLVVDEVMVRELIGLMGLT